MKNLVKLNVTLLLSMLALGAQAQLDYPKTSRASKQCQKLYKFRDGNGSFLTEESAQAWLSTSTKKFDECSLYPIVYADLDLYSSELYNTGKKFSRIPLFSSQTPTMKINSADDFKIKRQELLKKVSLSRASEIERITQNIFQKIDQVRIDPMGTDEFNKLMCEPIQVFGRTDNRSLPRRLFAQSSFLAHAACEEAGDFKLSVRTDLNPSLNEPLNQYNYIGSHHVYMLSTLRKIYTQQFLPTAINEWTKLLITQFYIQTSSQTRLAILNEQNFDAWFKSNLKVKGFDLTQKTESYSSDAISGSRSLFSFSFEPEKTSLLFSRTPDEKKLGLFNFIPSTARTVYFDALSGNLIKSEFSPNKIPLDESQFSPFIGKYSFAFLIGFIADSIDTNTNFNVDVFYNFYASTTENNITCDDNNDGGETQCAFGATEPRASSWLGGGFNGRWIFWSDLFAFPGEQQIRSIGAWKKLSNAVFDN